MGKKKDEPPKKAKRASKKAAPEAPVPHQDRAESEPRLRQLAKSKKLMKSVNRSISVTLEEVEKLLKEIQSWSSADDQTMASMLGFHAGLAIHLGRIESYIDHSLNNIQDASDVYKARVGGFETGYLRGCQDFHEAEALKSTKPARKKEKPTTPSNVIRLPVIHKKERP